VFVYFVCVVECVPVVGQIQSVSKKEKREAGKKRKGGEQQPRLRAAVSLARPTDTPALLV